MGTGRYAPHLGNCLPAMQRGQWSALFVGHDVKHHPVGGLHGIGSNGSEVVDALVHIVVDDAFGAAHTFTLHRE